MEIQTNFLDNTHPSPTHSLALALASTAVAAPTQINIHYTPTVGTLSLDFVSTAADGVAQYGTSSNPASFTNATTTSFNFAEIGYLHQTTMTFAATPGASAFYRACSANSCSQVFHVIPNQADETFAVFGDFGLINDVTMDYLTAEAAKGTYDSVLHVGDCTYFLSYFPSFNLSLLCNFRINSLFPDVKLTIFTISFFLSSYLRGLRL